MKIEITKKIVLKALNTERLQAENWIDPDASERTPITNCRVCAVGAVLCEALDPRKTTPMTLHDAANVATAAEDCINGYDGLFSPIGKTPKQMKAHAKKLLGDGLNPLAVLSFLFEGLSNSNRPIYRIRPHLISFVKEEFPAKFVADINGAKPAKGIKVVK